MAALLAGWWSAIWPNLAANVIWIPVVAIAHRILKRYLAERAKEQQQQLDAHAERLQQQLSEHHDRLAQTLGAAPTTEGV